MHWCFDLLEKTMPELPDSSRRKINSLSHELFGRLHLDEDTRAELSAHLEEKLAGYMSGQIPISEEDALILVRAHFGDARQIARRLRREQWRAQFFTPTINHARLHATILVIVGASTALTIPLGLFLWFLRQPRPSSSLFPAWTIPCWSAICVGYILAIAATLFCRRFHPAIAPRMTKALNLLLLAAPPFGTLLGIYGLLKLDPVARQPIPDPV
jgi:hypothetical protein